MMIDAARSVSRAENEIVTGSPKNVGLLARFGACGHVPALRIVVLTAEGGEGHLAAARVLAAELASERPDVEVVVLDVLVGLGRPLRCVLRDAYRYQLRFAPWIYGFLYRLFSRLPFLRGLGRAGLALLGARSFLRLIDAWRPDIVVSTYPAATSVLGYLRRRGRLTMPTCATATDLAGLEFWAHPAIDVHLVMHESCLAPVERLAGPGSARLVRPLVAAAFFEQRSVKQSRRSFGLALEGRLVVVSGGGWGAGDIEGAVRASLELPGATVVCLAGRNEPLRKRLASSFAAEPRVRVLGFTEQMSELLAAADAVVHSTGGVTCLEALVRGCPIVAYGAPPGHARLTARAMASLGLLQTASSTRQLVCALQRALALPAARRPRLAPAPRAATLVLAAEPRSRQAPIQRQGLMRLAVAAAAAATLFLGGLALRSDDAYSLVARAFDLEPITSIATERPAVALVIRAPAALMPELVTTLGKRHAHASFAFAAAPGRLTLATLAAAGDEALPELRPGGLTHWLETRGELERDADALGLRRDRFYLTPASGLTAGQYLLGRESGSVPIVGSLRIGPTSLAAPRGAQRGDVVVLTLGSQPSTAGAMLTHLLARLARERLTPVTFGQLVAWRRPGGA